MQGATADIIVDVPPKVIYDVVLDFEKYPEFLSDVKRVEIQKKGKDLRGTFEVSVVKTVHYTLDFSLSPSKKISWTFVEGNLFKNNVGYWQFDEVKKGQTKATYHIEVDFGFLVPSLVTNRLVGNNLPAMLKKFKNRAEKL